MRPLSLSSGCELANRLAVLCGPHGHVGQDGMCDDTTLSFVRVRMRSPWALACLGPATIDPSAHHPYPFIRLHSDAHVEACQRLIATLRRDYPDTQFGIEAAPDADLVATAKRIIQTGAHVVSVPLDAVWHDASGDEQAAQWLDACAQAARDHGAWIVGVLDWRPSAPDREIALWRARVALFAEHGGALLHVRLDPTSEVDTVGGAERASIAKQARMIRDKAACRLMISGRIKHLEDADRALSYHHAEVVGMRRASLVAPDLIEVDQAGGTTLHCTGCMACVPATAHITTRTPRFEHSRCALHLGSHALVALDDPRDVVLFGASAFALRAALVARSSGRLATLHPLDWPLGGTLRMRGRTPRQAESNEAALHLIKLCRDAGVTIASDPLPDLLDRYSGDDTHRYIASLPWAYDAPPEFASCPHVDDPMALVASSPHDRSARLVWGDSLVAVEVAMHLEMQAIPVCLVGPEIAADTHPLLQRFYQQRAHERRLPIVSPRDVHLDPTTLALHVDGWSPDTDTIRLVPCHAPHTRPTIATLEAALPNLLICPDEWEPLRLRASMQGAHSSPH